MSATGDRDFSVVVFGATGVTGRHVAAYLAKRAEETGLRWAAAGRDRGKVERMLGESGVSAPETIVADVEDPDSLAAMAARTRVLLNLVGPYTLYGPPVIEACVAAGTDYADLSGEVPFLRRTIDSQHERAAAAGVKVVQVAGFEALPPDLAVLLATETARERWDEDLAEVDAVVHTQQPTGRVGLEDIISGGTLQGIVAVLEDEGAAKIADTGILITDPETAEQARRQSPISLAPRIGAGGDVIAPMAPAAFINPAVIQRTRALIAAEQGRSPAPLRYREGMAIPGGAATLPLRYAVAGGLGAMQAGARLLSRAKPAVRHRAATTLGRVLPRSGFGPSGSRLEEWSWQFVVDARTTGDHQVRVVVEAEGHPGYLATARILGEAGMLLSEDGMASDRAGCLTPAAALGTGQLERFERAGARFRLAS